MMKKIVFVMFLLVPAVSFAQGDIDDLLTENLEDGKKLVKGYLNPFMKSVSLGLNQGWYNTAKPHKIAGIDLTITASAMTLSNSDLFYDIAKLELSNISLESNSPDSPKAPTVFGPDRSPVYRNTSSGETFEGPGGIDLKGELGKNWVPVPMVTLGFGLPKGTDIKFRFVPSIDLGDEGSVNMFGLGVMHDIKQYIPGLKLLPFDLSGFVGYTRLALNYKYGNESGDGYEIENGKGEFRMSATTIQGVVSKKFSVLTLYGGLGYNIAKSNIAVKGTWRVDDNDDGSWDEEKKNPVDLKFAASGPRATAGFRLKLAVFTLHADYTLQKYNALTVGFGINVR